MKRLHVHVSVKDVPTSIHFYRALFDLEPTVVKDDYAKWMLDDPRVNFAISNRNRPTGLDHLGIQVEDSNELQEVYARLKKADAPVIEESADKVCCYAVSEKSWIQDPQGIEWETFLTTGESTVYGTDEITPKVQAKSVCCGPTRAA
jgi:catechol 2,3-dioxygenase-like lactoylglutathione lyase family enzyme